FVDLPPLFVNLPPVQDRFPSILAPFRFTSPTASNPCCKYTPPLIWLLPACSAGSPGWLNWARVQSREPPMSASIRLTSSEAWKPFRRNTSPFVLNPFASNLPTELPARDNDQTDASFRAIVARNLQCSSLRGKAILANLRSSFPSIRAPDKERPRNV